MPTYKIICLANSRKLNHRCFAGKDVATGAWIRPVSNHDNGAISLREMDLGGGVVPGLLDIIAIPLDQRTPVFYQPENMLLAQQPWIKSGAFPLNDIDSLCDCPDSIWHNGPSNDRICVSKLHSERVESSLLFVKLERVRIAKRGNKVRAIFDYHSVRYDLGVTDIALETRLKEEHSGFALENQTGYFCFSLGEPFQSFNDSEPCCFKLVASVLLH